MTATTQVTDIPELLDLSSYTADHTSEYDLDAVRRDYADALSRAAGPGVHVAVNGCVYATEAAAARARAVDWQALAGSVDVDAILERHERPADVPVGLSDLPGLLGVAAQTPRRWRERGVLPDPDGHIGGSPWWWRNRIVAWHRQRRRDGA